MKREDSFFGGPLQESADRRSGTRGLMLALCALPAILQLAAPPNAAGWGESLGGGTVGTVSAVSWGTGRLDAFVRGADNGIYHQYFDNGTWQPLWASIPGNGKTAGDVTAVSWGFGRLDLFVRGTDNGIYHQYFDNGGWQ